MPALRPGDVVLMDNLPCHKAAGVARLIEAAGAGVRYLPAYSPDLNPIERLSSKLKAALRSAAARTVDAPIEAMGDGLRAVRPGGIPGRFSHSGNRADSSIVTANEKPHEEVSWSFCRCPARRLPVRPNLSFRPGDAVFDPLDQLVHTLNITCRSGPIRGEAVPGVRAYSRSAR